MKEDSRKSLHEVAVPKLPQGESRALGRISKSQRHGQAGFPGEAAGGPAAPACVTCVFVGQSREAEFQNSGKTGNLGRRC